MPTPLSRRQLLTATLSGAAAFGIAGRAQEKSWHAGAVRHLLPGVSHDRLLLKASFVRPMTVPPTLRAGTRKATGKRLDTVGEFYSFDLAGLEPEHTSHYSRAAICTRSPKDGFCVTAISISGATQLCRC